MNRQQLVFARELRGYNQSELSSKIQGLSQSNLSKFEKGLGMLSDEVLERITQFLNFPSEFFNRKINSNIENGNYRKRSNISIAATKKFENKCRLIGYLIDEMSDTLDWPEFKLQYFEVDEGFRPDYIAKYVRRLLKIDKFGPVRNIYSLLESTGIILYEIDEIEKIDGVSFFTDKGFPVIIVNKNYPNDRKRFTIAHELGHLLMHNENHFPISSHRDKEKEANIFAGEFLMPADEIGNQLRNLKFSELPDLKRYWLTSMIAIVVRAKTLGIFDENRYKYFAIEISRNGYSKKEPISVFIDEPSLIEKGSNLFKNELAYSSLEFAKYFALPSDILDELLFNEQIIKLKINI